MNGYNSRRLKSSRDSNDESGLLLFPRITIGVYGFSWVGLGWVGWVYGRVVVNVGVNGAIDESRF